MTTTNNELSAPTGLSVDFLDNRWIRPVSIPSLEALNWDKPLAATNCTIASQYGFEVYAELKITGRTLRRFKGGTWGYKARVRFTGPELCDEDHATWHDCVVVP